MKPKAQCKSCGRHLKGAAYNYKAQGNSAKDPDTDKPVPKNFYGGFVCSRVCDLNATKAASSSYAFSELSPLEAEFIDINWREK